MWHDIDQTQPATIFVSFFFSYFFLFLILYFVLYYIHIMWHNIDQTQPATIFVSFSFPYFFLFEANTIPKNPGYQEFAKILYNTGIEFLRTLGPGHKPVILISF